MLGTLIGLYKTYKWVAMAASIAAVIIPGFLYIQGHGKMKVLVPVLKEQVAQCQDTNVAFIGEIADLNIRIRASNAAQRAKIIQAMQIIEATQKAAIVLLEENEQLKEELKKTRFDTIEAIRDDEDFADWVDGTVPPIGWKLLRDAAEGSAPSD
jgi:O-succinylbenzoate synthase